MLDLRANKIYGVQIGYIVDVREDNLKPYQIDVVGVYDYVLEESRPWARVLNFGGGSYDSGGQPMYVRGATVAILFQNGNRFLPMIVGGIQKGVGETQEYASEIFPGEGSYTPNSNRPTSLDTDTPVEMLTPGVYTLYKSPKGATIVVSEAPEAEYFKFIDRAGQEIEMFSPVKNLANTNNKAQRGDAEAGNDSALPYDQIKEEAYIRVTDLSGNQIELYSKQNEERILIKNNVHNNSFELNKEGMFFTVLDGQGNGGLTIEATANGLKVNGQFLATESLVDWLYTNSSKLCLSTKPGSRSPIWPPALAEFVTQKEQTMNVTGLKSKL